MKSSARTAGKQSKISRLSGLAQSDRFRFLPEWMGSRCWFSGKLKLPSLTEALQMKSGCWLAVAALVTAGFNLHGSVYATPPLAPLITYATTGAGDILAFTSPENYTGFCLRTQQSRWIGD